VGLIDGKNITLSKTKGYYGDAFSGANSSGNLIAIGLSLHRFRLIESSRNYRRMIAVIGMFSTKKHSTQARLA